MWKRKKAQSILEYIILVVVIISAIMAFVTNFGNQNSGIGNLLNKSAEKINASGRTILNLSD